MSWNQCHCKGYQILIPTTIHGLKSKLEWLRYHENWDNALIDAPLTSRSHNFWFDHWIFKLHTFLETRSPDISKGIMINSIWCHLKMVAFHLKANHGYKSPQAPPDEKRDDFSGFSLCLDVFYKFFLSLKHKKHIKVSWLFFLHQKYKVLFLYPIFISLVLLLVFGV